MADKIEKEVAELMDDDKQETVTDAPQEQKSEAPQEQKTDEDKLELEGIEITEDGRTKYTIGNSVYFSKEGLKGNKALSDVWKQHREAEGAKDKAFLELKQKTSQERAKGAINLPKTLDDDEEDKLPDIPKERAIIDHVFKNASLDPAMAKWTDDDWIKYEDEKGLRSWQTQKLQNAVEQARKDAESMQAQYFTRHNNALALRQARDLVRDMVAEVDGVNPDDFASEFHTILKRAMKGEGLNEFKELNPAWVVKEFGKIVGKSLTAKQRSALEIETQKKVLESQEQRRRAQKPAAPAAPFKKNEKQPLSIAQATKEIMAEYGGG